MQKSSTCHLYAFITILLWSTSYVGTKIVSVSFTTGTLSVVRCIAATAVLLCVAFARKLPPPRARDLPIFLISGIAGISLYVYLFNRGIASIGPTTSCIIISVSPVIAAVLASIFFKEHLRPIGWAAIAMAFCGILLMALWEGTMNINIGVVWTALGAFIFAAYNLLQRKLSRTYDTAAITAYCFAIGTVFLLPYLPHAIQQMRVAPPSHTLVVVLMGIFPSAVAYLFWVKALSIAPKTSYVTNYMFLTPFASLALELAILRQWPDPGAMLGGMVILASLALFAFAGKKG